MSAFEHLRDRLQDHRLPSGSKVECRVLPTGIRSTTNYLKEQRIYLELVDRENVGGRGIFPVWLLGRAPTEIYRNAFVDMRELFDEVERELGLLELRKERDSQVCGLPIGATP